jgi:regulation of enolase protein 1 (concanavalin A-like superfamily)
MKTQIAPVCRALIAAALLVCGVQQTAHAQSLPAPWSSSDVGAPTSSGSATHSNGVFTVTGAGTDIWGRTDQFQFVYRAVTGDAEIIARVPSLATGNAGAKAGVMLRESLNPDARYTMTLLAVGAGSHFQRRPTVGGATIDTTGPAVTAPAWVRLVRQGDWMVGYASTDGRTWTGIGAETIPMGATVYVGFAVTSHNAAARTQATFDSVTVTGASGNQSPAVSLTQPSNGAQVTAPATVMLAASASDPENRTSRVDFYVEGTMIASDASAPYSAPWSAQSPGTYALSAVVYDADGGSSTSSPVSVKVVSNNAAPTVSLTSPASGATFTAPATISLTANASDPEGQLSRVEFYSGTTLLGSDTSSPYAFSWTNVAAGTYSLTARAFDAAGASTTSTAVSVTVNGSTTPPPSGSLPSPWKSGDVGSPARAGSASYASNTFTIAAGGTDIGGTSDQMHYAYRQINGDADVVARVPSLTNTNAEAKAGVMIRASLAANSRFTFMAATPGKQVRFVRRGSDGSNSVITTGPVVSGGWVRVVRTGNHFMGYYSADGQTWTGLAADDIPMGQTVYVGLAVTSHNATSTATASIDGVRVTGTPADGGNQPPTVSLTSPANNANFTAPATISIAASASDPESQLSRVDFFQGTTLLSSDTSSPYAFSWNNVAAGTYNLTAVAYDAAGASATSTAVRVTVGSANGAPTVALTSPANGATFTAPATVSLAATASDPENQLARVEFFAGSTRVATVNAAPYSFTWSNVAAGTYSITAVAYDTAGASATSAARSITVNAGGTSTAPTAVSFSASSDHASNVTSYMLKVFASGANPSTATPVATSDLGKPTPDGSNTITVDRASFFSGLAAGNYVATVTAIGPGGQTQSASVTFTR